VVRRKATKRWQIPRRGQAVVLVGVAMAVAVTLFQVSPASAEPPIYGAIRVKWEQLGGYAGLGAPLDEEHDTYDLVGRTQTFRGGVISWHPKIGEAFAVWGDILTTWTRLGRERWAYPVTDEWGTPDGVGRYNHF